MYPEIVLGSFTMQSQKACYIVGAIGLLIYSLCTRKKYKLTIPMAVFYSLVLVVAGLIEFKIMGSIQSWLIEIKSNGELVLGGSTRIFGVLLFQPIMIWLVSFLAGDKYRKIADFIAPGTFICFIFGKLACVFEGCCHGASDPNGIYSVIAEEKVFPVSLYESLSVIPVVIILAVISYKCKNLRAGSLFPIGSILYCIPRMIWENYRYYDNPYQADFALGLNFWQFFCVIALIIDIVWLVILYKNKKYKECVYEDSKVLLKARIESIKSFGKSNSEKQRKKHAQKAKEHAQKAKELRKKK